MTNAINTKFNELFEAEGKSLPFNRSWDNGTGYLDAIGVDTHGVPHGVHRFVTDGKLPGRKGIVVRIGNNILTVFERGEGDRIVYNANKALQKVFFAMNKGQRAVTDKGFAFFKYLIDAAQDLDADGY